MTHQTLTALGDLIAHNLVDAKNRTALEEVNARYAIAIPPHFRRLIQDGQDTGPIARQFVPDPREQQVQPEECADPIGDNAHTPVKGIVHRYHNRVLLKVVSVCPVYCRFCFRREMVGPGHDAHLAPSDLARALAYVADHPEIEEVIMTGGDPLVLSPRRIRRLTQGLAQVPHLKKLRWHSRIPVACPERVTDELIDALTASRLRVQLAVHTNHAQELTPDARRACQRLIAANVTLLSQSVLLRGVNDDPDTLAGLVAACHDTGIQPYYLHHLDLAPGTGHFRVSMRSGQIILNIARRHRPDLTFPTYMLDVPGGFGKVPIENSHVRCVGQSKGVDLYRVRDPMGRVHIYRDSGPVDTAS